MPIIVMPGQTLEEIAVQYNTTPEALQEGNCLTDTNIQQETIIFVPFPTAKVSQGGAQCGAPAGWVIYYVQPGDTLYGIATAYGISTRQLMYANCLQSENIMVGQALYVPNVPPYFGNPGQPLPPMWTPAPTDITFPMLLTPQTPMLPTGIPFPAP
jgi:LysM repeat protein